MNAVATEVQQAVRLDLGAGKNPRQGFVGVDRIDFGNGNQVADLRQKWPWADSSVDEAHSSHFVEHLTARERVHFCNELWRVLKPGAKCLVIVPHGCSGRAYGDLTHQWPPIFEFWFYYLDKNWRKSNAPHDDSEFSPDGYSCDFGVTWGYNVDPALQVRNQEYQQHAIKYWRESVQDIVATFEARK